MKEGILKTIRVKSKWLAVAGFSAILLLVSVASAQAATIFLSPASSQTQIGQPFIVQVRVSSTDQGFNAAQATIQFPKDILQVKAIDSSPAASTFNFWLSGPTFSNDTGSVSFIGGTTNGVVGASVPILSITFVAKGSGQATINISDAAVTASDGSGTNILATVAGAAMAVGQSVITPTAPTGTVPIAGSNKPATLPATPPVPAAITPAPLTRTPTATSSAPLGPQINIPLYPDQSKWYNEISSFLVQWKLTSDVSGISAMVDKNQKADPPQKSEGLYEAKAFPALSDGLWYVHLKFKNNVGWSPTSNYKIAVDTVPPLSFTVSAKEGATTDNPTPTLFYQASDGLSGISHYEIQINNDPLIATTTATTTLPLQTPGKKNIVVRAVDNAGNIRESNFSLEILPIAGPTVGHIDDNTVANQSNLTVGGTAMPNVTVLLSLKTASGAVVAEDRAQTDSKGNWTGQFNGPFNIGSYYIEATAQDVRGALSLLVKSNFFQIKDKPFLVIAGMQISQLWFFVILIGLLLIIFAAGWWTYHLWRLQLYRKAIIAERDVLNTFAGVNAELDKLTKARAAKQGLEASEAENKFMIRSIKTHLAKAERYIIENIKEIAE